jgi:hypothetical protein
MYMHCMRRNTSIQHHTHKYTHVQIHECEYALIFIGIYYCLVNLERLYSYVCSIPVPSRLL